MHEPIPKAKIVDYLKKHLFGLLKANCGGQDIRVWLSLDSFGCIQNSSEKPSGAESVGGVAIPPCTLEGGKIFAPKEKEVINFLKGFGLCRQEAEAVIDSVEK